ncbi:ArsR/SmtB family transcription factor [Priestia megaterium]|uniref:ArsR/SmtB family transcription factor n=1 Tax=Priestia megaterium TaxID=1404 RepID=UPI002452F18E|nr:metalloregulator ArsR/SmtB family transcription factor [Priestia megaterium]MDH3142483.1 metalloregulator ArsR/SmtB family transcription factor [Priestia megaterium]MED4239990.1 metalloregulator ArsR/SmtB family transcription factor [Priestia megaterium]MED4255212.1 metalloregulator ArsR/SmtB family transcription factor [Priestia megaterium]MED4265441.1 metalloregulator ArsR/SmtB family transcription factor [Priestia megaterium]MED4274765.1 metalloregulator ArsR/SmtB family transcription fa
MTSSAAKHDIFQAIADPTRRKVLELLSEKELPISEITSHFSISRTAIVKHLHILSEADLVHGQKKGREKVYYLQPKPLKEVQDWLSYYEQFWTNKLSILQHIVERDEERNQ